MQRREGHAKSSASVDAIGGGYAAFQKRALTRRKACRRNMHALLGKDSSHVVSGVGRVCDEGQRESVRLYMLGLPTLDDIAGSRKPVAVEESSAVHRGSSLTEDFRCTDLRAERRCCCFCSVVCFCMCWDSHILLVSALESNVCAGFSAGLCNQGG